MNLQNQSLKNQLNVVFVKKGFKIKKMPVCDHYHFTGQFRGAAHIECNPQYQIKKSSYQFKFNNLFILGTLYNQYKCNTI